MTGTRRTSLLAALMTCLMLAAGIACYRAWLAETQAAPAVVAGPTVLSCDVVVVGFGKSALDIAEAALLCARSSTINQFFSGPRFFAFRL